MQPCELLYLSPSFQDMTARDLLQQRYTLPNGDTAWRPSPLVTAAIEGKLLILDGIHRVNLGTLAVLSRYSGIYVRCLCESFPGSVPDKQRVSRLTLQRFVSQVAPRQGVGPLRRDQAAAVGQIPDAEGAAAVKRPAAEGKVCTDTNMCWFLSALLSVISPAVLCVSLTIVLRPKTA